MRTLVEIKHALSMGLSLEPNHVIKVGGCPPCCASRGLRGPSRKSNTQYRDLPELETRGRVNVGQETCSTSLAGHLGAPCGLSR